MLTIEIRQLRPEDDRTKFRSGNADLDLFFARYAGQNQFRHHIGTTYVAIDDEEAVVGFLTVAAAQIEVDQLPADKKRDYPRYPLPVLRIARLAIDRSCHGQSLGSKLLRHAFVLAGDLAQMAGCVGVVVDAKPDAVGFYKRYGFTTIEVLAGAMAGQPRPVPMFLSLGSIPPLPQVS